MVAHGDMAWVAEESKKENFNARERYAHAEAMPRKRLSSPSRDLASLGIKQ